MLGAVNVKKKKKLLFIDDKYIIFYNILVTIKFISKLK